MKYLLFSILLLAWPQSDPIGQKSQVSLAEKCKMVAAKKNQLPLQRDRYGKIRATLHSLYVSSDTLFLPIGLHNRSSVSYEIDFVRLYIRDKKSMKRTAYQELDLVPLYSLGLEENNNVLPQEKRSLVFALGKFTLVKGKIVRIEIIEKNGGRHLELHLGNKAIEDALPL